MFDIPINSQIAMSIVLLGLVIATAFQKILQITKPHLNHLELRQRIFSWWIMILLLFTFLGLGRGASIAFFGFLSFIALKEFLSIVPTRHADRRVLFWAYISIFAQYYLVYIKWYEMFLIFIPVYMFLFFPVRLVLIGKTEGFIRSCGVIQWGVMLTVFSLSHIAFLLSLTNKNLDAGPVGLVLFLIIFTEFNDICQYIWGKSIGKRKIVPSVSPGKTWGGLLGGFVTIGFFAYLIGPYLTPLNPMQSLFAGCMINVFGFFGDVSISAVKRDLQIKDSGNLLPGHGGILDRLDSLTYTAPLFFHYLYYFAY